MLCEEGGIVNGVERRVWTTDGPLYTLEKGLAPANLR